MARICATHGGVLTTDGADFFLIGGQRVEVDPGTVEGAVVGVPTLQGDPDKTPAVGLPSALRRAGIEAASPSAYTKWVVTNNDFSCMIDFTVGTQNILATYVLHNADGPDLAADLAVASPSYEIERRSMGDWWAQTTQVWSPGGDWCVLAIVDIAEIASKGVILDVGVPAASGNYPSVEMRCENLGGANDQFQTKVRANDTYVARTLPPPRSHLSCRDRGSPDRVRQYRDR